MSRRYIGGGITATEPVPGGPYATGSAGGVWGLQTQMQNNKAGVWPLPTGGSAPTSAVFSTPGVYAWLCPPGVTSVSVVAVGGGAGGGVASNYYYGGGGGGLGYKNNYSVTPGTAYPLIVGAGGATQSGGNNGGDSYFISASVVRGGGGGSGGNRAAGGTFTGDGGGNGGAGISYYSGNGNAYLGGGGGAGGYLSTGGSGGYSNAPTAPGKVGVIYEAFNDSGVSTSSKVALTPLAINPNPFPHIRMYGAVQMSNGNIFVAYISGTNDFAVYFKIYNTSGAEVVAQTTISGATSSTECRTGVKVALTQGGDVVVVWDRGGSGVGYAANCNYAIYNSSGGVVKSATVASTGSLDSIQDFDVCTTTQANTGFLIAASAYQSGGNWYVIAVGYNNSGTQVGYSQVVAGDPNNTYSMISVTQLTGGIVAIAVRRGTVAQFYMRNSATDLSAFSSNSFDGGAYTIYSVQATSLSNGSWMYSYLSNSSIRYAIYNSSGTQQGGTVYSVTVTAPTNNTTFNIYTKHSALRLSNNNILFTYATNGNLTDLRAVIVNNTPSVVQAETTISSQYNALNVRAMALSSGGFVPFYEILGGGGFGGTAYYNSNGDKGGDVGGSGIGSTQLYSSGFGSFSSAVTGGGGGTFSGSGGSNGFVRILYGSGKSFPFNAA